MKKMTTKKERRHEITSMQMTRKMMKNGRSEIAEIAKMQHRVMKKKMMKQLRIGDYG
jgi:hypothetical protein